MADRDRPPTQCYNARSRGGIESGADQSSLAQPMAKFGFSQQTSRKCTWGRERTFILILHQPSLGLQFVSLGNLHQRALAARAISVYLIFQFTVREVSKCLHLRIRYVCLGKVITCDRCWTGSNVIRLATRLVYPLMTIASTPFQRPLPTQQSPILALIARFMKCRVLQQDSHKMTRNAPVLRIAFYLDGLFLAGRE